MRLNPSKTGDTLVASGTIYATFGLPLGMEDLTPLIDVRKIWPDTLIFNGEVPRETPGNSTVGRIMTPGDNPLPDPLPERAFARILPEHWIPAQVILPENTDDILGWDDAVLEDSHMYTEKEKKVVTRVVTAEMIDAPLDVLPGRDDEFQAFVRKVSIYSFHTFFFFAKIGSTVVQLLSSLALVIAWCGGFSWCERNHGYWSSCPGLNSSSPGVLTARGWRKWK